MIVLGAGGTVAAEGRREGVMRVGIAATPATEALGRVTIVAGHGAAIEAVPAVFAGAAAGPKRAMDARIDHVVLYRAVSRSFDV